MHGRLIFTTFFEKLKNLKQAFLTILKNFERLFSFFQNLRYQHRFAKFYKTQNIRTVFFIFFKNSKYNNRIFFTIFLKPKITHQVFLQNFLKLTTKTGFFAKSKKLKIPKQAVSKIFGNLNYHNRLFSKNEKHKILQQAFLHLKKLEHQITLFCKIFENSKYWDRFTLCKFFEKLKITKLAFFIKLWKT